MEKKQQGQIREIEGEYDYLEVGHLSPLDSRLSSRRAPLEGSRAGCHRASLGAQYVTRLAPLGRLCLKFANITRAVQDGIQEEIDTIVRDEVARKCPSFIPRDIQNQLQEHQRALHDSSLPLRFLVYLFPNRALNPSSTRSNLCGLYC